MEKINRIVLFFLVIIVFISCKTSKDSGFPDAAFKQYLVETNKMDKDVVINDSHYDKYFLQYLNDETKKNITNNSYLKANQVYVYLNNNHTSYMFSIFSDDGELYTGAYAWIVSI